MHLITASFQEGKLPLRFQEGKTTNSGTQATGSNVVINEEHEGTTVVPWSPA
jgi:hypothetical protein